MKGHFWRKQHRFYLCSLTTSIEINWQPCAFLYSFFWKNKQQITNVLTNIIENNSANSRPWTCHFFLCLPMQIYHSIFCPKIFIFPILTFIYHTKPKNAKYPSRIQIMKMLPLFVTNWCGCWLSFRVLRSKTSLMVPIKTTTM